jgi:hypothetical protein
MKYIITENQRDRIMVKRRLPELKDLIRHQFPYYYPCDFDSLEQYMMAMKIEMFEVTILDWFEDVDKDVIWDMVTDLYGYLMVDNYTNRCKHKMR